MASQISIELDSAQTSNVFFGSCKVSGRKAFFSREIFEILQALQISVGP